MANLLAWQDFSVITDKLQECEGKVKELYHALVNLNSEKVKIVDDQDRLNGIIEIINIHPDWTVQDINSRLSALKELGIYINNSGLS